MFIRTLWTMRTHRWRGPADVTDVTTLNLRVLPQDLDLNLHMNNGRYFSVADIGRIDWWLRTGLWQQTSRRGWRPVAGDSSARFTRSLQPFQAYQLRTRLLGWNRKWLFAEHCFVVDETIYAAVMVRYLFITSDGPRPTPAQVLELIGVKQESPALPEWVEQWSAAQDRFPRG